MNMKRILGILLCLIMLLSVMEPVFAAREKNDPAAPGILNVHTHKYGPWKKITEATCKQKAREQHTCTICGHTEWRYTGGYGDHQWGEFVVVREATPELPGLQTRTCSVCGAKEDEEIPYAGEPHQPVSTSSGVSITLDAVLPLPGPYRLNDTVLIYVTLTNTCDQVLHYTDSFEDLNDIYPESIAPNESWTSSKAITITEEDIEKAKEIGMFRSIEFWAVYEDAAGEEFATDDAQLDIPLALDDQEDAGLMLSVMIPGGAQEPYQENETIIFDCTLINTGKVPLSSVVFEGPGSEHSGEYTLAPGENVNFGFEYTVTDTDVEDGWLSVEFDGRGLTPDSNAVWSNTAIVQLMTKGDHEFDPLLVISVTGGPTGELKLGSVIPVTIVAENVGNVDVDIEGFVCQPDKNACDDVFDGWLGLSKGWLAPEESLSFGHGIVVSPQDIADGKVHRDFALNYSWDILYLTTNTISVDIPLTGELEHAELTLTCAAASGEGSGLGDDVTAPVVLVNSGNVPVTIDNISVAAYDGDDEPDAYDSYEYWTAEIGYALEPGEPIFNFHTTHVVTPDMAKNFVERSIKISGYYSDETTGQVFAVDSNWAKLYANLVPEDKGDALLLTKQITSESADPLGYQVNETITYQLTLTNVSDETVHDIEVFDAMATGNDQPLEKIPQLAPAETRTWTYLRVVTEEDVPEGHIYNEAYADYTDPVDQTEQQISTGWVIADVIAAKDEPQVTVYKSVSLPANGEYYVVGEEIKYEILVTNNSKEPIYNCVLSDPLLGDGDNDGELTKLEKIEPGQSTLTNVTYTITEADAYNEGIFNQASLSYMYYRETYVEDSNKVYVAINMPKPALTIVKTETSSPKGDRYELGEEISYTITVTNNSGLTLYDVVVYDSLKEGTGEIGSAEMLYPSQSRDFYFTHKVDELDASVCMVTNYAMAEFTYNQGVKYGPVVSEPVISPVECAPDIRDPLPHKGESCVRILVSKGSAAAEYEFEYCAEHLQLVKEAEALIAEAQSDNEKLSAWKKAVDLWTKAVNDLYAGYLSATPADQKPIVIRNRTAFRNYLSAYETTLKNNKQLDELTVTKRIYEVLMSRAVDLCYAMHHGPETRPDSEIGNTYQKMSDGTTRTQCAAQLMGNTEVKVQLRTYLCKFHAQLEEELAIRLKAADTTEALYNVFAAGELSYRNAMTAAVNKANSTADKDAQRELLIFQNAAASLLDADNDLYLMLYPRASALREELLCREAREILIAFCE